MKAKLTTLVLALLTLLSCHVYRFRDVSIPPEIKTVRVLAFENKASYVNPVFASSLVEAIQQKIGNQTRLIRTNSDDAHYIIRGTITGYNVTTSGVSQQQAVTNNLSISIHIQLKNTLTDETKEYDVSRPFSFSASLSITQAETALQSEILKQLSDEIFNNLFSNW